MENQEKNYLNLIEAIGDIIGRVRIAALHDEKKMQDEIVTCLTRAGIPFSREHKLSQRDIPDFFIQGVVVEIKIKGSSMAIFRQCERYCKYEEVGALILLTNKSMALPDKINNKITRVLNPSKAWL